MDKARIENLISRSLDGVLSEEEQLELNRELIRNPEAQRLMDACRKVDALAAAVLDEAVPERGLSYDPTAWIENHRERKPATLAGLPARSVSGPRSTRRTRDAGYSHRRYWLIPGAIAAALLAVVVNRLTLSPQPDGQLTERDRPATFVTPIDGPVWPSGNGMTRPVSTAPPQQRIQRDIARDLIGVIGEDGRIYWIEVDRTRTWKRPNTESGRRPVSEEM